MIAWIRAQWAKVTFYYGWPSWVVELCGGVVLGIVGRLVVWGACVALHLTPYWWAVVLATNAVGFILSYIYERFIDPNGMDWKDIGQRQIGIMKAALGSLLL